MVRVLTVLREYINECDSDYHEERTILPMSRFVEVSKTTVTKTVLCMLTKEQAPLTDSLFRVILPPFKPGGFLRVVHNTV